MEKLAILSVPRSGSSWVGQIFNSSPSVLYRFQPNFSYSFEYKLNKQDSELEIENFHKNLEHTKDPFVTGKISISGKSNVQFSKKEKKLLVWKEVHKLHIAETLLAKSDTKIICLVRSPFAVLNSWFKIPKEFDPSWSIEEEWEYAYKKNNNHADNYFGYSKWKEVTLFFLNLKQKYPKRVHIVNYEDLLHKKNSVVSKMFNFAGLQVEEQTKDFLNTSSDKNDTDAYSIFKVRSKDDSWKKELPQPIINFITNDKDFKKLNSIFNWHSEL